MIDVHCHILPSIDDGPATVPQALELARALLDAGTRTVVATPHVSDDWPGTSALKVAEGVLLLKRELRRAGVELDVRRGAEVALDRASSLPDRELARLRLGGSGWLLLEPPHADAGDGVRMLLQGIGRRVDRVLLAHPERVATFQRDPHLVEELVGLGMRCQLTAGSLEGTFGRTAQAFAEQLLDRGLIHVVASDAHGTGRRGPMRGAQLLELGLTPEEVEALCVRGPAAALSGEAVTGPEHGDLPAWRRRRLRRSGW